MNSMRRPKAAFFSFIRRRFVSSFPIFAVIKLIIRLNRYCCLMSFILVAIRRKHQSNKSTFAISSLLEAFPLPFFDRRGSQNHRIAKFIIIDNGAVGYS